jgi:hypothetical protein
VRRGYSVVRPVLMDERVFDETGWRWHTKYQEFIASCSKHFGISHRQLNRDFIFCVW